MDIKSIVDTVGTKASELARSAVKKTGEVAESAKLTIAIKSEQNKLDNMFTTLGKLFYEQAKGTDVRAQVAAQIMEIDEQKKVIEDLRLTAANANGKMICDSCGKTISLDDVFCPVCGKKIEAKLLFKNEDDSIGEDVAAEITEAIDPEENA